MLQRDSARMPRLCRAHRFPTHNPTHNMRCLVRLPRTLAVPAVLQVVVRPNHAPLSQQQPEFGEVRNCDSGIMRELAVPPSKLVLLFNAAFCRRDQSLSLWRETRFMERAMGIEPIGVP
jgi:hypothetical protein